MKLDAAVIQLLGLDASKSNVTNHGGGGSSSASTYKIHGVHPDGTEAFYFMKTGTGPSAELMFKGEHASLVALSVVPALAPRSHGHGTFTSSPNRHFLVTDFLSTSARGSTSGPSLAKKLAQLHTTPAPVPDGHDTPHFGFPTSTCCGDTPQDNTFCARWADFFAERRLRFILGRAEAAQRVDRELRELVTRTADAVVPRLLGGLDVRPVVVHRDLWSGNAGRGWLPGMPEGEAGEVVFDPSACWVHSEYDLGIMRMFGGFGADFFREYHALCPKTEPEGEHEDRVRLYEAYHHLNRYAMFGGGYRSGAVRILKDLVERYG